MISPSMFDTFFNFNTQKDINVIEMQRGVTKKLFLEKVIGELKQHPFYKENQVKFNSVINGIRRMDKQLAISEIISLLEQNFKCRLNHKKKFHHVLTEMMMHFHQKNFSNVLTEMMMHFHQKKFHHVLEELIEKHQEKSVKKKLNVHVEFSSVESALTVLFIAVLFLRITSFNWFDN